MSTAIEFKNVNKSYGDNNVIKNLSFTIDSGEFITVIGSSGSGKTTVLKMTNNLITPTDGDIFINGENIKSRNPVELRRNIGYAIQGSVLFPHLTVEQNISYVPNLINKKDKKRTKQAVSKWMGIVGLNEDIRDRYPSELSGGQQQRVGIARALAASPSILLMDEPFGAVDEITRLQLQSEIKRIHNETKITVMFVTHDISEALKLGTRVMVMNEGKIEQYDTPDNILKNPATGYVKALTYKQRHICNLPEDKISDCEYSGSYIKE